MYTTNNKQHYNLVSNVPFEKLPEWFRGDEEFETKRGTEKFRRVENSFKVAKLFVELNFN